MSEAVKIPRILPEEDRLILENIPDDVHFTLVMQVPARIGDEPDEVAEERYNEHISPILDEIPGVSEHYFSEGDPYGLYIEFEVDPYAQDIMQRSIESLYGSVCRALRIIYPIDHCQ